MVATARDECRVQTLAEALGADLSRSAGAHPRARAPKRKYNQIIAINWFSYGTKRKILGEYLFARKL